MVDTESIGLLLIHVFSIEEKDLIVPFVAAQFRELLSSSSFFPHPQYSTVLKFRTLLRFPWIFPGYSVSNVSLYHGSIPTDSAEGVVVHD